jgi:hypothetical protein
MTKTGPSWRHRRRLIYLSYVLGAGMIIFGAVTFTSDTQVASQLIIGGVSLISIILTAYTAFATFDDRWHWTPENSESSEELSDSDDKLSERSSTGKK